MDTVRETDQISCSWCGGYSMAGAMCELCGSPLADAASESITDGVTVFAEETRPVQPLLSPPVDRAPVLSLPEPVPVQAASRPVDLPMEVGRTKWIRYRRSLQVRWLIEAVTS